MPGEAQVGGFHQTHNAGAECFMNWKDFTSQEGRQGKGGMWNTNSSIRDTGSISAALWFMSSFWLHCLLLHSSPPKESESPDDLLKGRVTYKQNPATQYFWLSLTEVNALVAFPLPSHSRGKTYPWTPNLFFLWRNGWVRQAMFKSWPANVRVPLGKWLPLTVSE